MQSLNLPANVPSVLLAVVIAFFVLTVLVWAGPLLSR